MKTLKTYQPYNARRYGKPWVAIVSPATGKPDFKTTVGNYTGYNGDGGDLYIFAPQEGAVYMYGQKDYRGNYTARKYALYINGTFHDVDTTQLISVLQGDYTVLNLEAGV